MSLTLTPANPDEARLWWAAEHGYAAYHETVSPPSLRPVSGLTADWRGAWRAAAKAAASQPSEGVAPACAAFVAFVRESTLPADSVQADWGALRAEMRAPWHRFADAVRRCYAQWAGIEAAREASA